MTIDGALYRAGRKGIGGYARTTSFESREAEEAFKLSQMGRDAYMAEKEAEIERLILEERMRQQHKKGPPE